MNLFSKKLLVVLIAGAAAQVALAAGPVATVNGTAIPQGHADALITEQTSKGTPDNEQLRGAVREELVRREILFQTAQKEGLDKTPEVATQIELARKAVVIRAYLQGFVAKNPVTDADVRKAYDEIKSRLGDSEYHARHILVDDEAEALAIIAKINKGEKFDALAKAHSKDPGSKDKGGDLGWNNPSSFVQQFSDAMVALEKGKMTPTPVKSNFGYHIIKLEDVRKMAAPSFDEVSPQLKQRLQAQSLEQHILQLRTSADVK